MGLDHVVQDGGLDLGELVALAVLDGDVLEEFRVILAKPELRGQQSDALQYGLIAAHGIEVVDQPFLQGVEIHQAAIFHRMVEASFDRLGDHADHLHVF